MTVKLMIAAGALLASTSAFAQAGPESEQTSQDLVCQLADTCPTDDPAAAVEEVPDVDAAPASVPGARVSGVRGFAIANKVNAAPQVAAQPRTKATPRPGARFAATPAKPAAKAGKSGARLAKAAARPAAVKNAGSGRADLRVSFVSGSAELTEAGQREAIKFVEALQSPLLAGMRFRIEGHTDAVGSRASNLDLSRRRAQAVVDYLAGKGADRSRFDVTGYGFDRPLAGTPAGAAANRRVEVVRIR